MKKTFRTAMFSTVAMLIVGVMSLTGVTYAWFTQGTTGQVTGMEMTVTSSAGGVQVSEDANSWASILPLTTNATATNVYPVSTIGPNEDDTAWSFFTAEVSKNDSNQIKTAESATANYIAKTLYIKNDSAAPITVTLGEATTGGKVTKIEAISDNAYNGELASRLGIQLVAAKSTLKPDVDVTEGVTVNGGKWGIFEPNAKMHLGGEGEKVAYKGVTKASGDAYFNMGTDSTYLSSVTTVDDATKFEIVIPAQTYIEVVVYVWLEGQDSDCTNAVSNSAFKVDLILAKKAT